MPRKSDKSIGIDLGDDLLNNITEETSSNSETDLSEEIESAKILIGEGLLEDAKKRLRRVLLLHSDSATAKTLLDQIHELELQQLFDSPNRIDYLSKNQTDHISIDDQIFTDFDESQDVMDLDSQMAISNEINSQIKNLKQQDRIDLGIAFYEMRLLELALKQFEAAFNENAPLESSILQALCLISLNRESDAISLLEKTIRKLKLENEGVIDDSIEAIYLLGVAYQKSTQIEKALQWFTEVYRVHPSYRDVKSRILTIKSELEN